jgi:hypothetical protein
MGGRKYLLSQNIRKLDFEGEFYRPIPKNKTRQKKGANDDPKKRLTPYDPIKGRSLVGSLKRYF